MLIDVGIWGSIPTGTDITKVNKLFEAYVQKIGGRKMLYAEAFYTEKDFGEIYDHKAYMKLREKYKVKEIFPTLWEKTRVKKRYAINKWKGAIETIAELFKKKFL